MFPLKLKHGDSFSTLFDRFNQLIDYLREIRLVAGPGIRINRLPAGIKLSTNVLSGAASTAFQPDTGNGGPFAVTIEEVSEDNADEPNRIIRLYDSSSDSGTAGMVTIGSYREMIEDQKWDAQAGIVYLDITYDPETEEYDIIFDLEDELPETGDEQRYILRIAEITHDEETDTWEAHQIRDYGDIEVLGRWVR